MKTYVIYGPVGFGTDEDLLNPVCILEGDWESTQKGAEAVVASGVLDQLNLGQWEVMPQTTGKTTLINKGGSYYRFVEVPRLELPVGSAA